MSESKIAESKDDFDMTVNDGDDEEEIICEAAGGSAEDDEFDRIVGCLEEVMMDPAFSSTQTSFCLAHCSKFDRSEENKLEYTLIFEDYTKLMESIITTKLSEMIDGFSMQRFEEMLVHRQDEIGGEIFDVLMSLSDFDEFKDLMLSHKKEREEQKLEDKAPLAVTGRGSNSSVRSSTGGSGPGSRRASLGLSVNGHSLSPRQDNDAKMVISP